MFKELSLVTSVYQDKTLNFDKEIIFFHRNFTELYSDNVYFELELRWLVTPG